MSLEVLSSPGPLLDPLFFASWLLWCELLCFLRPFAPRWRDISELYESEWISCNLVPDNLVTATEKELMHRFLGVATAYWAWPLTGTSSLCPSADAGFLQSPLFPSLSSHPPLMPDPQCQVKSTGQGGRWRVGKPEIRQP